MKESHRIRLAIAIAILVVPIAWFARLSFEKTDEQIHSRTPPAVIESQAWTAHGVSSLGQLPATGDNSASDAFECDPHDGRPYMDSAEIASRLAASENPEHQLMVALAGTAKGSSERVDALHSLAMENSDDPLPVWNLLTACSLSSRVESCGAVRLEPMAIKADGRNGQMWAKIAALRIRHGDEVGALHALGNAATAPTLEEYWAEHIELFERGFAAAGVTSYRSRIFQAIGIAAAMVFDTYPILESCRAKSAASSDWRQHCLRYGHRLERDGKTFFSTNIGTRLQKSAYEASGDASELAAVAQRQKKLAENLQILTGVSEQVIMSRDENVLAAYVQQLAIFGELRAAEFVSREVERLLRTPGYDPCQF